MVKQKLAMVVGVIATLVLAFGGTASAQNNSNHGWQVTVQRIDVEFTLTPGPITNPPVPNQCPNLVPFNTSVHGEGQMVNVFKQRTDDHGILHIEAQSEARGSATDSSGNSYRFFYDNRFSGHDSLAESGNVVGIMTDLFWLKGPGPVNLRNGFVAEIAHFLDAGFTATPISQFGNPFNFPSAGGACDPL